MSAARRQRGVALITAMLVTALVVAVSVAMVSRQQLDMRRTGNILLRDQSYVYALGLESFIFEVLKKDDAKKDHLGEPWAFEGLKLPFENGQISPFLEDLQGRFNINNLVRNGARSDNDLQRFRNLLEILRLDALASPDLADNQPLQDILRNLNSQDLANAVMDWLDPDTDTLPGGGEDGDYQNGPRPYRTANHAMGSPSELLLVHGFNPTFYRFVEPYITTLPVPTTINVNTAKDALIRALAEDINCIDTGKLNRPVRQNPLSLAAPGEGGQTASSGPAPTSYDNVGAFLQADAFAGCKLIGTLGKPPPGGQNAQNDPADKNKTPGDGENPDNTNKAGGDAAPTTGAQKPEDVLSVNSQFFLLTARADMGFDDQIVGVTLYSVIQRIGNKLATIARSQGVY